MKKVFNKFGNVLIYTLFLVTLFLLMLVVLKNNINSLYLDYQSEKISTKLNDNVLYKSNIWYKYLITTNSNGTGFIDNISCPTSITMSGTINKGVVSSTLTYSGGLSFCSGSYQGSNLAIYFNSGITDFDNSEYLSSFVPISSGIGSGPFGDSDSTLIDFSASTYLVGDNIDDNFNSDNYIGNSTGSIEYPDSFIDDDDISRRELVGYILPNTGYSSIFWSNKESRQIISDNLNNTGSNTSLLGNSTGSLYLEADTDFNLKIVEFDRDEFNNNKVLIENDSNTGTGFNTSIGYIQDNAGVLSFSGNITGNEFNFDFINKDYGVFLENTGTGVLFYTLRGESMSGERIYISPINDSLNSFIDILGNDILIDNAGKYIYKQFSINKSK